MMAVGKVYRRDELPVGAVFVHPGCKTKYTVISQDDSRNVKGYHYPHCIVGGNITFCSAGSPCELVSLPDQDWPEYEGYEVVEYPDKVQCLTCYKKFKEGDVRYRNPKHHGIQRCRDCIGKVAKRKFKSTEETIPEIPIEEERECERTEDPETYGPAWFHEIMSNNRLTEEDHAIEVAPKKTETEIVEANVKDEGMRISTIDNNDMVAALKMLCPDLPDDISFALSEVKYLACFSKEFCGNVGTFKLRFDGEKFRVEGM